MAPEEWTALGLVCAISAVASSVYVRDAINSESREIRRLAVMHLIASSLIVYGLTLVIAAGALR